MRRLLLALCFVSPVYAGDCGPNCTDIARRPDKPGPLELCQSRESELMGLIATYVREIEALRAKLEEPAPTAPAAEKPATRKPTRCKRGRTRNAAGVCGRWK